MEVVAYDKVGNCFERVYDISEFSVEGHVTRIFKPFNNEFWTGEYGWLYIDTSGFVDSIKVTFPNDLVPNYYMLDGSDTHNYSYIDEQGNERLPQSFTINVGDFHICNRQEKVLFHIMDERSLAGNIYNIKVEAIKNGETITVYPELKIIGYSSDYSRTRIK